MIKVKYMGEKYGRVVSVLPNQRYHKDITQLRPQEIAQLILDLKTIPQPLMRTSEAENLVQLLLWYARRQWGAVFSRTLAIELTMAMQPGGITRYDDAFEEASMLQ